MQDRNVVHEGVGWRSIWSGRQDVKLGLVEMKIVVFARHVNQRPRLCRGLVAWRKWQAYVDHRVVEFLLLLEGAWKGVAVLIDFFVTNAEVVRIVRG